MAQSLESLRSEMVDGVTSIEFSHLRVDAKIGSGSFAEVYRVSAHADSCMYVIITVCMYG